MCGIKKQLKHVLNIFMYNSVSTYTDLFSYLFYYMSYDKRHIKKVKRLKGKTIFKYSIQIYVILM